MEKDDCNWKKGKFPFFSVYDLLSIKLFTRLRLQFSHLNEHKFRHGFVDTVTPICACNAEIEDTEHFLLRFRFDSNQRLEFSNNINKFDLFFTQLDTKEEVNILLYDYPPNKSNALNQDIIKFVINFLRKSGHFDKPLISFNQWFYVLLFFFLPICLLHIVIVSVENDSKFVAYNWLQISWINTFLLKLLVYCFYSYLWPAIIYKY